MWAFSKKNTSLILSVIVLFLLIISGVIYFITWNNKQKRLQEKYEPYLNKVEEHGMYNRYFGLIKKPMIIAREISFDIERKISGDRITNINNDKDFLTELGISMSIIINLDISPEKLKRTVDNMVDIGITNIYRMRGFNGKTEINAMKINLIEFSVNDEEKLNKHQDFIKLLDYDRVGTGQQGCACSHLYILKYIVQNNIEYTAIFEDDVCFHPDFKELFTNAWKNRPEDGVLFNMGCTTCDNYSCKKYTTPTWVAGAHKTTSFYVVSLEGAKRLLARFSKKIFPIIPCMDDMPFLSLENSYKLYYNNNNSFKNFPNYCGNRKCGVITTPVSESSTSSIRFINKN